MMGAKLAALVCKHMQSDLLVTEATEIRQAKRLQGLQHLHGRPQPGAVAGSDPHWRTAARLRLQSEVQGVGFIEQLIFQQAVEHRAQTRGTGGRALGQIDAVP